MADFQIHYAKTATGRTVAFGVMGAGPILVVTPGSLLTSDFQNFDRYFASVTNNVSFASLARSFTVVAYDYLGTGLSERAGYDYSPEGLRAELEAVVGAVGKRPIALLGRAAGAHTAIRFAAEHSADVAALVLMTAWVSGSQYYGGPAASLYEGIRKEDWETGSEYFVRMQMGLRDEQAKATAAWVRSTADKQTYMAFTSAHAQSDVSAHLADVRTPTLLFHMQSHMLYPLEAARGVAAAITGCRLAMHVGADDTIRQIEEFVLGTVAPDRPAPASGTDDSTNVMAPVSLREREVLDLISRGRTNAEIAAELVIAEATVARHVHNILNKLELTNRTEAAAWWTANGRR